MQERSIVSKNNERWKELLAEMKKMIELRDFKKFISKNDINLCGKGTVARNEMCGEKWELESEKKNYKIAFFI